MMSSPARSACLALALVVVPLAGCTATKGEVAPSVQEDAAPEPTVAEQASPAETCADLADDATYAVTRELYSDTGADVFDAAVAACADDPGAAWQETFQAAVQDSSYVSHLRQTIPVTDVDGYSFDLEVDFGLVSVSSDPSTQPPGVTAATRNMSLDMRLVNTTPQREVVFKDVAGIISPLSDPTFFFSAAFDAGNPVCTVALHTDQGCEWPLGFGRMESGLTLAPDQTYDLKVWGGLPNGGDASLLLPGIPEESWAELQPHLTHPDGYRISYSAGDNERFPSLCPDDGWGAHYATAVLFQTTECPRPSSS